MPGELQPGTAFGGYRIESVLGRGGMGIVYLAEHAGLQRRVALKVLAPQLAEEPSFRARFTRESRTAAALDHPNVVPIYEAGEAEGQLFIAMRYVEGTDLRTLIGAAGPLEPSRAVALVTQAADALDAAHRKGLVHRDVKPGNFLIAEGGHERAEHVYLSDFGLTKRAVSDSGITGTGQFVGTLEYAAPEQFEGRRLDAAADVYSLGCVLYECLTGTPPFRRESDAAIMHAHLLEDVPSVSSTRPGVPAALDVVVARAMAKRPSDRYPSAGALATAAQHAVSGAAPPKHAAASPRLRSIVTAAVLLAFLGATVALVLIGSQGREPGATRETSVPGSVALPAGSVTEIDPATRTPVGDSIEGVSISVFRGPETRFHPRMAAGAGGVWVVDQSRVTHVDPQRGEIEAEIPYQSSAGVYASVPDVLAAYRTVWVTSSLGSQELRPVAGVLKRIDPATNEQIRGRVFRGTGGATGVTASMDSIWATFSNGIFLEIDPETLETGGRLELGAGLDAVAASEDDVWVADRLAGTVVRVDPRTGEAGARSR